MPKLKWSGEPTDAVAEVNGTSMFRVVKLGGNGPAKFMAIHTPLDTRKKQTNITLSKLTEGKAWCQAIADTLKPSAPVTIESTAVTPKRSKRAAQA